MKRQAGLDYLTIHSFFKILLLLRATFIIFEVYFIHLWKELWNWNVKFLISKYRSLSNSVCLKLCSEVATIKNWPLIWDKLNLFIEQYFLPLFGGKSFVFALHNILCEAMLFIRGNHWWTGSAQLQLH